MSHWRFTLRHSLRQLPGDLLDPLQHLLLLLQILLEQLRGFSVSHRPRLLDQTGVGGNLVVLGLARSAHDETFQDLGRLLGLLRLLELLVQALGGMALDGVRLDSQLLEDLLNPLRLLPALLGMPPQAFLQLRMLDQPLGLLQHLDEDLLGMVNVRQLVDE